MKLIYGLKQIAHSFLDNFKEPITYPHVSVNSRIAGDAVVYAPKKLFMGEHSCIGCRAVIMNTRAEVHIGRHFVSGPKLTIITGDHMPIIGRFLDTVSDADKDRLDTSHLYDQDVIIKDDVWTGYGVTIMKGVTIDRGSIIAAGSIVTHSLPPYCLGGYSSQGHKI